ncbi:MAG: DUF4166 domain-containing protein [Albidovulum sp.]|uniref:SDR family oxidoreductase n=1 Tax=Albidovulum sp. TaxID=1872424 RepID=UPI003C97AA6A
MRVVVLGGTGVFGSRIAELLVRDGHDVLIAARRLSPARKLANRLVVRVLQLDLREDLTPLWAEDPGVVVDAAGPYHAYAGDPYRIARACIAHGVGYLDLADDPAFCEGIAALDEDARKAGTFALSGVSSVPALSSAVVAALAGSLDSVDVIDMAILPGNRAPRGASVIQAILSRTGAVFRLWQGGGWDLPRGWSKPRRFQLAPGLVRTGYLIEVPDNRLFPRCFGASTVTFRAGLELWPMNAGLALLSWLRAVTGVGMPRWAAGAARLVATMLWPFGTARGGMIVQVTGRRADGWSRREWCLVAEAGNGPFVPAVAARAILRAVDRIRPGARPALAELPLAEFEAAMSDLAVTTGTQTAPLPPLFPAHLGDAFLELPVPVRESHDWAGCLRLEGRAEITRGQGLVARLIAGLFGFPPAGSDVPVTVTKWQVPEGEVWLRDFGGRRFRSHLRSVDGRMTERFGPFTFALGLNVTDGTLAFPVAGGRIGPLPLPWRLLPGSVASEREEDGRFHFDVELRAPLGFGRIVHYRGWLSKRGASAPDVCR